VGIYQFGLGLGLAFVAGFRSYFPLLIVGLIGRFAEKFPLQPPFRFLTTIPVLLLFIVLMGYEVLGEKASGYANGHALLQLGLKVVAGGVLFAGMFNGLGNFFGFIFGGFIAGLSHSIRAYYGIPGNRPGLPLNNIEDALAVAGTVLILLIPWLSFVAWGLLFYAMANRIRQSSWYTPHRRTRSWR